MEARAAGRSISDVAAWFKVSRHTVARYTTAAAEQGRSVPEPRPMGGYRWSRVQRGDLAALAALALEQPKRTLQDLRALAADTRALAVSTSTVARALHKTGLQKRRARFVDPRVRTPLIAAERQAFRHAQRTDPLFSAKRLLWYDETLFYLNEQARSAWGPTGPDAPVLHRTKGRTASTGLLLTLGLAADGSLLLHYQLQPPARPFVPLAATFQASELELPGRGVELGLDLDNATTGQLRGALRQHGVRHTDLTSRAALVARARQLVAGGVLGLPRAGRADVGGAAQPVRNTVRDVALYLEQALVPWLRAQGHDPAHRTLCWDNAPTHSPVQVQDAAQISMFHRLCREWGLRGCLFLPPRSPRFQPVEACFAFVKHRVRQGAPGTGYTQAGLEAAIRAALARVTAAMVRNWIRGCGYRAEEDGGEDEDGNGPQDDRATAAAAIATRIRSSHRKHEGFPPPAAARRRRGRDAPLSPRWADAHGTLWPRGARSDLVDVRARPAPAPVEPCSPSAPRRWPGYPGGPPAHASETRPAAYSAALVDHERTFEPERIVGERRTAGATLYRIRWRGYAPEDDTWEPLEHLQAGRRALLRDWEKRRGRAQ